MLTSFGMFWGAEGAGASWPGSDAALLAIVPAVALFAIGLVRLLRREQEAAAAATPPHAVANAGQEEARA
jgi:uncharacterized membrane protein